MIETLEMLRSKFLNSNTLETKQSHKIHYFIMAFLILFSIPSAFADVEFVGVDIFCPLEELLGFTNIVPFLEICPIDTTGEVDSDGDGLLDDWEINGIDGSIPPDGIPDFILVGADPFFNDIYVEIDYMEHHEPNQDTIDAVIAALANAPVGNPSGNPNGINLHVDLQDADVLVHQDTWFFNTSDPTNTDWPDFDASKAQFFGTSQERTTGTQQQIDARLNAKFQAYHYATIIHNVAGLPTTGIAEIGGNDFVISLGNKGEEDADTGHVNVDHNVIEGTFMHELGHNLGLYHGGFKPDDLNNNNEINIEEDRANNCKPNYLSVMSYSFQLPSPMKPLSGVLRPLDYSRSNITTSLNENALIESVGIGASEPPGLFTIYGPLENTTVVQTGNPVDWNEDGDFDDIFDRNIGRVRFACDNDLLFTQLKGHDDWENLDYDFKDSTHFAEGVHPAPDEIIELTQDQIEQLMNLLNRIPPTKDSFLTQGNAKQNEGANPILRIISSDKNRPVIAFDQTKIENAATDETLRSATLRLYITDNGNNWGPNGRNIAIHSLTQDWEEGNGWNTGNNISGDGSGVTWNCPIDTDISNNQDNCSVQWDGGSFASTATDSVLITNDMINRFIEFDVTSDVQAYLDGTKSNFGWIIKKGDEAFNGSFEFVSKENGANNPELFLVFE